MAYLEDFPECYDIPSDDQDEPLEQDESLDHDVKKHTRVSINKGFKRSKAINKNKIDTHVAINGTISKPKYKKHIKEYAMYITNNKDADALPRYAQTFDTRKKRLKQEINHSRKAKNQECDTIEVK